MLRRAVTGVSGMAGRLLNPHSADSSVDGAAAPDHLPGFAPRLTTAAVEAARVVRYLPVSVEGPGLLARKSHPASLLRAPLRPRLRPALPRLPSGVRIAVEHLAVRCDPGPRYLAQPRQCLEPPTCARATLRRPLLRIVHQGSANRTRIDRRSAPSLAAPCTCCAGSPASGSRSRERPAPDRRLLDHEFDAAGTGPLEGPHEVVDANLSLPSAAGAVLASH
jgi:hypothetical protein